MREWRRMTWAMALWSAMMVVVAIVAAFSATGRGVIGGFVLIWAIGMGLLGMIWLATRPAHERPAKPRECPACGLWVPRGETVCEHCGHDFAARARATSQTEGTSG